MNRLLSFKMMIILLFLLPSCVTYHSSNVSRTSADKVTKGMDILDVRKKIRKKPYNTLTYKDGSYNEYYTYDYKDGGMFYCNSLMISYGSDDKVILGKVTGDKHAQSRCDSYATQYQGNMNGFAAGMAAGSSVSRSLYDDGSSQRSPSNQKTCSSDYSCDSGQKCAKKSNGFGGTEYEGVCIDVYYYNGN